MSLSVYSAFDYVLKIPMLHIRLLLCQ